MKKLLILVLALSITAPLLANDETLIGRRIHSGGFGGPVVKFTQMNGEFALLVGGRGGWIINRTFVIGGGGYGLTNYVRVDELADGTAPRIELGYGGFEMEYVNNSHELVHFTVSALIGAGGVNYRREDLRHYDLQQEDAFFVTEPAAQLMLNVTTFFRVGIGASYRFILGVEIDGLDEGALAGPTAFIGLKFGSF